MGDKQVLQRGNLVRHSSKGERTARPLEDNEVDEQIAKNSAPMGSGVAAMARAKTIDRLQAMPNRRDAAIDEASGNSTAYKRGGMVSKHGFSPMKTTMARSGKR